MKRRLLAAVSLSALACGPSVQGLVADRHYREAVCAAVDDPEQSELVGGALDLDANVAVHAQVIDSPEVRAALSGRRGASDVVVFRVSAQSDTLPVDALELAVQVGSLDGTATALGARWDTLAWATGEPLPPRRQIETYITNANALRATAAIVTAGLSLLFTRFRPESTMVDPLPEEYERFAPRATSLHALVGQSGCRANESGNLGGVRCEWFFVYASRSPSPLAMVLSTRFTANRNHPERTLLSACSVTRQAHLTLGARATLAADLDARFGPRSRTLREIREEGSQPPVRAWEQLEDDFAHRDDTSGAFVAR